MSISGGPPTPRIGTPAGDGMILALRVVSRVLGSPPKQQSLQDEPGDTATELGLPPEAGPLLLNILNAAERRSDPVHSSANPGSPEVRRMLFEPFKHIRWAFNIPTSMSVLPFL